MNITEIIDILETDTLSYKFSSSGLQYLSLKDRDGEHCLNLKTYREKDETDPFKRLLIRETINFLNKGTHSMPLDLSQFTDFQRALYKEVSKIKRGEIYTYKEVAIMLSKPEGARAVGNALSKNPVSYFIPTHRVLPKSGIGSCTSGAGYLKKKLLILEGHDIKAIRS